MTVPYGQSTRLGISFQDSYGTQNVSSMHWLEYASSDLSVSKEAMISENMRGVFEEGQTFEGATTLDGTIVQEANPIALGALLTAVMDAASTVMTSHSTGTTYEHTWVPRQTDWDNISANPPATIYEKFTDAGSAMLYVDMVGNSIELSIANKEFLKATVGFVGGKFKQIGSLASQVPTGNRWTWDSSSLQGGSNNIGNVMTDLTLKLDEGIEGLYHLGSGQGKSPGRMLRTGFRTIEISGTMRFLNQIEFQKFVGWQDQKAILHFEGATEIRSGVNESLTIELPQMRYTEFPINVGGPGIIEIGFSGKGEYSVGSGSALKVILVNTQSAYI